MPKTVEDILSRLDSMQSDRQNFDSHCQEVADYVIPRKGNITTTRSPGIKLHRTVYDATGMEAHGVLVSGLHGEITNPASKWFNIRAKNRELMKHDEVKLWFGEVTQRMYDVFENSNFYVQAPEMYAELTAFGTGPFYCEQDPEATVRFDARPWAECYIAENEAGKVDTDFRQFTYTVRQMEQRWGRASLSKDVNKRLENKKFDDQISMLHAVYPREDYDSTKVDSKNLPFASMYVEVEKKHIVNESGYHEFPYAVPRWEKMADEIYGRSPAMKALPFIKVINAQEKTMLNAGQKAVNPPLLVPWDGYVMPIKSTPGSFIMQRQGVTSEHNIQPLESKANLPAGFELMDRKTEAINRIFHVDLFLMLDMLRREKKGQITATEILERVEEKMKLLGPVLGRLFSEFLSPLIQRVFAIMQRTGALPPMPDILENQGYQIEYISPLARAQRIHELRAIQRSLDFVAPIVEVYPAILDKYDFDKITDRANEILGVPPDLMRSDEDVEKIREQRQETQQTQQALELASQAGLAGQELGKGGKEMEDVMVGGGARA